jgi:hypothetical protein
MKEFYLIIIFISGLSLGYMAISEINTNTQLRIEINKLKKVIDEQQLLLNNCNID